MALLLKLVITFTLVAVFLPGCLGSNPKPRAECIPIYLAYQLEGTHIKHCTVRVDPYDSTKTLYWMLVDCFTWADAKKACATGGGKLASFPTIEEKFYMIQFFSPMTVGESHCYAGGHPTWMYGTWIGLSRTSSSSKIFNWEDGTDEEEEDFKFEPYITYNGGTQKVSDGNCVLAARTALYGGGSDYIYIAGYRAASCATQAPAICMKGLS